MQSNRSSENRGFKVTLIVLLGLAAFSSARNDLNHLREFVSGVQELAGNLHSNDGLLASNQSVDVEEARSCANVGKGMTVTSFEYNSGDQVELLKTIESEGADEPGTEPEVGGQAEVAAKRMALNLPEQRPVRVLKGDTFAKSNNHRWPEAVEIKKINKEVTLDFPMLVFSETKADSFNADRMPEFPATLLEKINRRQLDVKFHNGKREWVLRKIDGNLNVRRSS